MCPIARPRGWAARWPEKEVAMRKHHTDNFAKWARIVRLLTTLVELVLKLSDHIPNI